MALLDLTTDTRGVATLTLSRPEVHNAFNDRVIAELTATFETLAADAAVRVLVLTGAGASFSAGGDLDWMRSMTRYTEDENRRDALALARMLDALDRFPKPTVARVNGAALGGGVGLVSGCDIAIAAETARFGLTEVRLGLAPATIAPYVVRAIGARQARRYFLTGERFDAPRALALGLVHEVVPATDLDAAVGRVIADLLKGGPAALAECKALVRTVQDVAEREALMAATADLIARMRVTAEGQEGLAAFFDKRAPAWTGEA
jgi:methylglutaconyl-CoA hydratase